VQYAIVYMFVKTSFVSRRDRHGHFPYALLDHHWLLDLPLVSSYLVVKLSIILGMNSTYLPKQMSASAQTCLADLPPRRLRDSADNGHHPTITYCQSENAGPFPGMSILIMKATSVRPPCHTVSVLVNKNW
jgi:hypothetical protein